MKSHWITPYWDHYGLPFVFISMICASLFKSSAPITTDMLWTIGRSLIFFYMMWRIIRQSQYAVEEMKERDEARLTLLRSAEDYAKAQAEAATLISIYTKKNSETMAHDLATIRTELIKNTALTIKAGNASVEAANMSAKIAETHDTVIEKLAEMTTPPATVAVSLQHIDDHTAAIAKNTETPAQKAKLKFPKKRGVVE